MRRMLALLAVVAFAAIGIAGCGDDDDAADKGNGGGGDANAVTLTATDFSFKPADLQLKAGEKATIELKNDGKTKHNLTIKDLKVDEDVEGGKSTKISVEPKAGNYQFQCEYHPDKMKGTITVK